MKPTSPQFWFILVLLFAFVCRMYQLSSPPKYVFDEVYHALTAKLIARNDPRAYEWWHSPIEPNTAVDWLHPPLAKYTQAVSIKAFGENSFGWRFSSAVFGVGVIALVYVLTQLAFKKEALSVLAAFLASLDGLLLVQSRVAMNDIHVTFFIVLTLIFYLLYREKRLARYLILTGITGGLAMGTKWSGVFVVVSVGVVETIDLLMLMNKKNHIELSLRKAQLMLVSLVFLPIALYVLSYSHMFLQGKDLNHLYKLHQQIWWYQTNLTATHGYQSRPWQWFLDLRPVWFHVDYTDDDHIGNIYSFGNPLLFWAGASAVIGTIGWLVNRRTLASFSKTDVNLILIFLTYLMVWFPWTFSPRIMFFYHYTPAVPFLCIILAYWLHHAWSLDIESDIKWNKLMVGSLITLIAAVFFVWYPNWTAITVPKEFANRVYFSITEWK